MTRSCYEATESLVMSRIPNEVREAFESRGLALECAFRIQPAPSASDGEESVMWVMRTDILITGSIDGDIPVSTFVAPDDLTSLEDWANAVRAACDKFDAQEQVAEHVDRDDRERERLRLLIADFVERTLRPIGDEIASIAADTH